MQFQASHAILMRPHDLSPPDAAAPHAFPLLAPRRRRQQVLDWSWAPRTSCVADVFAARAVPLFPPPRSYHSPVSARPASLAARASGPGPAHIRTHRTLLSSVAFSAVASWSIAAPDWPVGAHPRPRLDDDQNGVDSAHGCAGTAGHWALARGRDAAKRAAGDAHPEKDAHNMRSPRGR